MTDWNPWLTPDPAGAASNKGGEATVEPVGAARNVVWQTRAAPPTPAENRLADALQAIFADEIYDLPGIVTRLNAAGVTTDAGTPWTEPVFRTEMARLGTRVWD